MSELQKIVRVLKKGRSAGAAFGSCLVLDATTGQNAHRARAEIFREMVGVHRHPSWTKLDGTRAAAASWYPWPKKYIRDSDPRDRGVGETGRRFAAHSRRERLMPAAWSGLDPLIPDRSVEGGPAFRR